MLIQIWFDGHEPPVGRVIKADDAAAPSDETGFSGWLDLLAALDRLLRPEDAAPGAGAADAGGLRPGA